MKTVSLQTMPNGFELEMPTFGYWFKVGAAIALGVVAVSAALSVIGFFFMLVGMKVMLLSMLH